MSGARSGALSSAFDHVEAEVRELVRRRNLHPVQDRQAMRRLIGAVVVDCDLPYSASAV